MAKDGVADVEVSKAIADFTKDYATTGDDKRNRKYYAKLAQYVAERCDEFLQSRLFDANVTSRAKSLDSLRKKLIDRHPRKNYENGDDIREDIKDLSGVRIALFLPHHKARVNSFLERTFDAKKVEHPSRVSTEEGGGAETDGEEEHYHPRFNGYHATHYRVRFWKDKVPTQFRKKDWVEIQVMSVLQSAWSEVEHNILYKKLKGSPSFPEKQMLDGLNGLVNVGDLYLEQLNKVFEDRVNSEKDKEEQFGNKYELGSFLFSRMRQHRDPDDFDMSSVELLRKFLQLDCVAINSKEKLSAKLIEHNIVMDPSASDELHNPYSTKPNISLIIMDRIFKDSPTLKEKSLSSGQGSDKASCEVLFSTIISLDELFPPVSFWELELMECEGLSRLQSLKWLMEAQILKNVLIGDEVVLDEKQHQMLQTLWNWMESHPSGIVRFVFSLSRLGVLRDFPQDIPLFERIHRMVQENLDLRLTRN